MFVIETDVAPIPSKRGRKPTEFPFAEMAVGTSFLIPCDVSEKKVVESWRRKLLVAKKRFAEQFEGAEGAKFTTAVMADGLRVWRTA